MKEEILVTTIIFDVDDTLYDQLKPFKLAFEKNFSFPDVPIEKLFKLSRIHSDEVFDKSENGSMSLIEMQIYRIRKALEHFDKSITDEQGERFQIDYQSNQMKIKLLPEMRDALDVCVNHGFRLGIITNGPAEHQQKKIETLKLDQWISKEDMFISGKLGYAKPDIKIFQFAEKKMGLDKNTTYYVGDSFANDVVGAKNAGWKAVWINRRNHEISQGKISPDYIVDQQETMQDFICSLMLQNF